MTNEQAIDVLKTSSCTDCACGCDSPMSCENNDCKLKKATKKAIIALIKDAWDEMFRD